MERITDKTKRKNWIDGDTFAVKIENYSDKYNGKYLILIKSVNDIWKKDFESKDEFEKYMRNSPSFYIKITKDKEIPNTYEELNKLEYIKTWVIYTDETTINRFDKGLYSEADDFNYTYEYLYKLYFHREFNFSDFIYIGNYKFDSPKNEFIPYIWVELTSYYTKFDWIKNLIDDYENYNLRKSSHFTPEGSKRFADKYKGNVIFVEEFLKLSKLEMKKTKEIYLYGLGPKLYDAGLALEIRTDYRKYMRKNKKNNQSSEEMIKELCDCYEDYINDPIEGPLFWITLADLLMKDNILTEYTKKKALEAIEQDLDNWRVKGTYIERKKVLDSIKKKLEDHIL